MAEQFAARPSEVVACGGELAYNAGEVRGVQSSLQSEGGGAGVDGCATEPGDMKSFWDQLDWVVGTLKDYANVMGDLGSNLQQSGVNFQGFDQGSAAPGTSV